jgi:predicted RNase H-like HicB family nuclease
VGYLEEDGLWVAHCLETDLVGQGSTFEKAAAHLEELTEMQVSFALQRGEPALIYRPAPPWVFEMFQDMQQAAMASFPNPPRQQNRGLSSLCMDPDRKFRGGFNLIVAEA